MVEPKNIKFFLLVLWVAILVTFWMMFFFMPTNNLLWLWLGIICTALGIITFSVFVMIKAIKYVILVGFIWVVIMALLIVDVFVTHVIAYIDLMIFAWIAIGVILFMILGLLKKMNATEW